MILVSNEDIGILLRIGDVCIWLQILSTRRDDDLEVDIGPGLRRGQISSFDSLWAEK